MRRKLSIRILLPNLIIVIGSLAMLALTVLFIVHFYLNSETEKELHNVRATTANLIKTGLQGSPEDALTQAQAASIMQTSLMFDVRVLILTDGMDYPATSQYRPLPKLSLQSVKSDGGTYGFSTGGVNYIATAIPFKAGKGDWNFLIYMSLEPVHAFLQRLGLIMLIALAGAALIAVIASIYVARRIAGPLGKLSRWAHMIGGRQYDRYSDRSGTVEIDVLAESLNGMAERLENYDAAQKVFLQNASHELRTPLMSIQGYAEGIKHGVFDDTGYAADIIIAESLRLSALVDDLLYLSRLETTDGFYIFAPVSVGEVLGQCSEKLEGVALKDGKELSLAHCPQIAVNGDGEKLLRAVMNLTGNCLRYAKTKVEIQAAAVGSRAVITISDDGPGFDTDDLKNMFTRYYKGKTGKHGLGLSIVKAIVEKHGGSIFAANGMNGGAVFKIELPMIEKAKNKNQG